MTKRERIEEMGAARVMLSMIIDDHALLQHTESKHSFDAFCKSHEIEVKEGMDQGFYQIHLQARCLREKLEEVYCLLHGYE